MHTAAAWDRADGDVELTVTIEPHPHVKQELGALPRSGDVARAGRPGGAGE